MPKVIIYTSASCGYCNMAKQLLSNKNVEFTETRIDTDPELRQQVIEKSGQRTVPQIFINDKPIGGFDDLKALDNSGELNKLLTGE